MKIVLYTFIMLASFSLKAQNTDELVANWKYKDVYQREKLEEKNAKMVDQMFADLSFKLKKDGAFISTAMGKAEEGKWTLNKKIIELKPNSGKSNQLEIIELKNDQLIVKMGSMSIILAKEIVK